MTRRCRHILWDDFPRFRVRILTFMDWQRVLIPEDFVHYLIPAAYETTTLEDQNGFQWNVKLEHTPNGTYIGHGWMDFFEYHNITGNNEILFVYDCNTLFYVDIFDNMGREREYEGYQLSDTSESNQSSESSEEECEPELDEDPGQPSTSRPTNSQNPQAHVEGSRDIIQQALESAQPTFPHFVKCLTARDVRKGQALWLPLDFVTSHMRFRGKARILLITADSQIACPVNILKNKKRAIFSGGWSFFVETAGLQAGHVCIFELIEEGRLRVHIR